MNDERRIQHESTDDMVKCLGIEIRGLNKLLNILK